MRCPECGRSLDEDARFCKHCGRPVGPPEEPAGPSSRDSTRERKIATLLFADIVGFTSIGEVHDPELVASLVTEAFERLAHEVRRYEGTVEKFAGDALLAVFGVPAAHEDDPERAVRAALGMQAAMDAMRATANGDRPELELRVGIDTGEVLVDRARVSSERDLFVTGDAVNTAARLEAAAEPGTIIVGDATHSATSDVVAFEALSALELKGKAGPVAAWRVLAVRAAGVGRRAHPGLESPLVGRSDELARLKVVVHRAVEEGRPQLVTILGNAGVGKSRLARELESYLDGLPEAFHWRVGRCVAYADRSFGPIADVVKADAGITDDDGPAAAREKLRRRLTGLGLEDEERVRAALEAVLGVGDRGALPRGELFEAWRRYLAKIAARAPLVLVMEDIHWADDDVLAYLDSLARWGEGPVAIVCLARHELLEHRASWADGMSDTTTIALEPLDEAAATALVGGLLDGGLPPDLKVYVAERSEGNPLFAEETVRMLVDRGVLRLTDGTWQLTRSLHDVKVPQSIHAVLASRLDALLAAEKHLVQDAAVVGRIFWDTLVAHLGGMEPDDLEERLRTIRGRGLVVARQPSSLAGAHEFAFRHVLVRDVAYESLPKRDRAIIHERIATWMEELLADRIDEFAEPVATHLSTALGYEEELAARGSAELHRAREHTYEAAKRAARRASSLGLGARACAWMRPAIGLAQTLGRSPHEIACLADEDARNHGMKMNYGLADHPDHVAVLSCAVGELERAAGLTDADEQLLARLRSALGGVHLVARDFEAGREVVQDGLARLEDGEASPGRARLHHTLGLYYWRVDSHKDAVASLEIALAEATACADAEAQRWVLHDLGVVRFDADLDSSIGLLERSYRLALDAGDRPLMWRCRYNLAQQRHVRGDSLGEVLELSEACVQQERLEAEGVSHSEATWFHAYYLWEMGSLDEALAVVGEALEVAVARGAGHGAYYGLRALISRSRGEIAVAERDDAAMAGSPTGPIIDSEWAETILERAWGQWMRDPRAAVADLEASLGRADLHGASRAEIAPTVARMALRLGDRAQLERAISAYRRFEDHPPTHKLRLSIDGLAAGEADAGVTLEGSAAELEENGYSLTALDLWMDAALMAARAGRGSEALDRARAIIERTGLHPLIGPIPETRWLPARSRGRAVPPAPGP